MEIDAWDHKGRHYSGQGKDLNAALKDARKQALEHFGKTRLQALIDGKPHPWPIVAHRECNLDAPTIQHFVSEWRYIGGERTDERRNL